jgi:hypothetical protein
VRQRHDHGGSCNHQQALVLQQESAHMLHAMRNVLLQRQSALVLNSSQKHPGISAVRYQVQDVGSSLNQPG